jgi:hypothetical protein
MVKRECLCTNDCSLYFSDNVMDDLAIELVKAWNSAAGSVGAESLTMRQTATNGYRLAIFGFILLTGGGWFFGFRGSDEE